jgi:ribonucleoside-triphosphate reductase
MEENKTEVIKEKCNARMEVYFRVVGFYRPYSDWNVGKKAEFLDRKTYKMVK